MQYTIHTPMIISSRLMPALKVWDATVHLAADSIEDDRVIWRYIIDGPDFTHEATDLSTPFHGVEFIPGQLRSALDSLLSFWEHIVECRDVDAYPAPFYAWLRNNEYEVSQARYELGEEE